jgi:hypothetical protein
MINQPLKTEKAVHSARVVRVYTCTCIANCPGAITIVSSLVEGGGYTIPLSSTVEFATANMPQERAIIIGGSLITCGRCIDQPERISSSDMDISFLPAHMFSPFLSEKGELRKN